MKRIIAAALLAALLLSGCGAAQDDLEGAATKAQAIEIRDAEGEEILSITDSKEIEEFVSALEMDSWSPAAIPQDAGPLCTVEFYQEKTVKLGQTPSGELYRTLGLKVYEGGFLTLVLEEVALAFEIPPSAAEHLEGLLP